jgi:DNA-binding XRE family transcriptional regulator
LNSETLKELREAIKEKYKLDKFTQIMAARLFGVHSQAWSSWENGTAIPEYNLRTILYFGEMAEAKQRHFIMTAYKACTR